MFFLNHAINMKKSFFLFFCFFLLLFGCNSSINHYDFDTKTIRWNSNRAFEIKDIVSDIQYIILEETPESLFSGIYKLVIKNGRIYVLDISPKSLFVFDVKGKFLHRVGRLGSGPGEYSNSMINFAVNENDEVFVYDYARRNMMKYDKNGKYINSKKSSFSFNDFLFLSDDQYLLSLDIYEKNNLNRKVMLSTNLSNKGNSFFYFNKDFMHDKLNMMIFQPFGDKIAYMRPVNDTLFIFDNTGSLKQAWYFDFGNRKMPEDLKNNYEKAVKEMNKGNRSLYIKNTPLCVKNYIFTEIVIEGNPCISVYDTTKNILTHEILSPDKFSLNNINQPLCVVNDSLLVSYLDPDTYFVVKESSNFSINPEIDAHLANGGTIIILNTIK